MISVYQFLKDDGSLNLSKLTKSQLGKQFLIEATAKFGEARAAQLAYRELHKINELPSCKRCGSSLTVDNFIDFKRGYRTYCSTSCSSKDNKSSIEKFIKLARSPEFINARRQKILAKYGTSSMISVNRAKAVATSLERYGVDNPLKSAYAKQRKVELVIERYGVDNVFKLPAIQAKIKETLLARYGVMSPLELVDWSKLQVTKGHQELIDFIHKVDPKLKTDVNDRKLISPQELDIYLPEKKLAIEYNGLYWHGDASGKPAKYHLQKTESCNLAGIRLIHIFEDEWRDKREIVESRLKSALGISARIYARMCELTSVSSIEADQFCELTHLQGRVRSSVRLGLRCQGELVAIMTFGRPRFNRNFDWELLRYSSKLGCNVIGGASRLLAAFRRSYSGTIITYADRRWSQGNLYVQLGFKLQSVSQPSYFYVGSTMTRINRVNAQKHRLDGLLGSSFDPKLTESENMKAAGFDRVFDCGNFVFTLQ